MNSLEWNAADRSLIVLDQTLLPVEVRLLTLNRYEDVVDAIQRMAVRGAPLIGISAAYGLALAGFQTQTSSLEELKGSYRQAAEALKESRPTAIFLKVAVERIMGVVQDYEGSADALPEVVLEAAHTLFAEEAAIDEAIAENGAKLIDDGDRIVHHCNTGGLASAGNGTALGVIKRAWEQGKHIRVFVDETRPCLQGARLTAWELEQWGIPYEVIVDGASGQLMRSGQVEKVLFGADRVAMNGDVVNKIGTYMLALAAYDNVIPAYAVFPTSTIDSCCMDGVSIPLEQRDPGEVLGLEVQGRKVMPASAHALNYAFDVTPNRLLAGLVTEKGVFYPPYFREISRLAREM